MRPWERTVETIHGNLGTSESKVGIVNPLTIAGPVI